MNFPHEDSIVYQLRGVDPTQLVVFFEGSPPSLGVFVRSDIAKSLDAAPSAAGLVVTVPGLCPYRTDPPLPACIAGPS